MKKFILALTFAVGMTDANAAWFEMGSRTGESSSTFVVEITDEALIEHARKIVNEGPAAGGTLMMAFAQPGGDGFNRDLSIEQGAPWSWHVREVVEFVDATIELCDGSPELVELNPAEFLANTSGKICFWDYIVRRELAAKPQFEVGEGIDGAWIIPGAFGQGLYLDYLSIDSGFLGFSWMTYDPTWPPGRPAPAVWFSGGGRPDHESNSIRVDIYSHTGGVFGGFSPSMVAKKMGDGEFRFSDCNNGSFTFSLGKRPSVTQPLVRAIPRAGCVVK